ncbi:unnamed protein product [Discula destructiva]
MSAPKFDITPEKQASVPRFFYNQLTVTPAEVREDLREKTAIVTGANSGVGFATSLQLLDLGVSKLIIAVRSMEKGRAAQAKLQAAVGRTLEADAIEIWTLDLSIYSSVVEFAERSKGLQRLDIVILNVGIYPATQNFNETTKHDEMIQVNYLSTALLAILLLPVCKSKKESQSTRMTFVSSEVASWTNFSEKKERPLLAALDKPGNFSLLDCMMVSKLLGQFFVAKLATLVPQSVAVINAVSPAGVHDTGFNREHEKGVAQAIGKWIQRRIYYTSEIGARIVVDAAVSSKHGKESHGQFFSFQKMVPMAPIIYLTEGQEIGEQLWKETLEEFSFVDVETILKDIEGTSI